MALDIIVNGGSSTAGKANVDTNFNVGVVPPKTVTQTGFVGVAAIRDAGTVTGVVNASAADVDIDDRLRVGLDTEIFTDTFNYTAQNTANWQNSTLTMTIAYAAGLVTLNNSAITTLSTAATIQSYRSIPLFDISTTRIKIRAELTLTPVVNNSVWLGVGRPSNLATAPTDGCYF